MSSSFLLFEEHSVVLSAFVCAWCFAARAMSRAEVRLETLPANTSFSDNMKNKLCLKRAALDKLHPRVVAARASGRVSLKTKQPRRTSRDLDGPLIAKLFARVGVKVYTLLDRARVTIARQEALAAEEAELCERSDFLDSSR